MMPFSSPSVLPCLQSRTRGQSPRSLSWRSSRRCGCPSRRLPRPRHRRDTTAPPRNRLPISSNLTRIAMLSLLAGFAARPRYLPDMSAGPFGILNPFPSRRCMRKARRENPRRNEEQPGYPSCRHALIIPVRRAVYPRFLITNPPKASSSRSSSSSRAPAVA